MGWEVPRCCAPKSARTWTSVPAIAGVRCGNCYGADGQWGEQSPLAPGQGSHCSPYANDTPALLTALASLGCAHTMTSGALASPRRGNFMRLRGFGDVLPLQVDARSAFVGATPGRQRYRLKPARRFVCEGPRGRATAIPCTTAGHCRARRSGGLEACRQQLPAPAHWAGRRSPA